METSAGARGRLAWWPDSETSSTRQASCTWRPSVALTSTAANLFWACGGLQQLRCPAVDRQLSFKLLDAPPRREQLSPLHRRQAGLNSMVDPVLVAPAVDRLVADPKVSRDVLHAAPLGHHIQNSLAKLW